jgi:hypothetical protein
LFPNLNSGKVQKFQRFGNLCIWWQPKKWEPPVFSQNLIPPSAGERELLLKASMQIQLDKMLSQSRLVALTNDAPNFKPEPRN